MRKPPNRNLQQKKQGQRCRECATQPGGVAPMALTWGMLNILATFLDLGPDVLLVVNPAGTIIMVTRQTETLFGYHQDELIGQTLEVLLPEHLRVEHKKQRIHYMQAAYPRPMGKGLYLVARRKDGSEFPVDISLQPILLEHTLHIMAAVRDITVQRELAHTAERLCQQDKLISMAHDAIVVCDAKRHIRSWNEGAERLYGWTVQETIGQSIHRLLQTRFPISQEAVDQVMEHCGQWEGQLIHTRRDGTQVIVESRQVLMHDERGKPLAILEINRDVTERHRLERVEQEASAQMKARLDTVQLILEEMPTGAMLIRGLQARLIFINRAARALWGAEWKHDQSMEDFLTQHGLRLFSGDGRPISLSETITMRAMVTGEATHHCQQVIRRADGSSLPILVSAVPFDMLLPVLPLSSVEASKTTSSERIVLVVYEDVTALKEAEALKDQFISMATHELRTPVTVIAGYTDMLLRRAVRGEEHRLDEWQSGKLQEMKQATQQLTHLTQDLLDVTRVQAGQFQLHLHPTDLVALTRQVIERLQTTTERHQLSFHTNLTYLWATVDAERVEQILGNLLSNAIKYSPQGGPIEVALTENAETREACFRVCDHGMGISYAQQAHIFGRFVRADNVRTARISGTGLGLYLCRELVERHGGHIYFESEEGIGTTFFFSLPCNTTAY